MLPSLHLKKAKKRELSRVYLSLHAHRRLYPRLFLVYRDTDQGPPQAPCVRRCEVDRIESVHREQLQFVEIYAEQLRRWRTENPSISRRRKLDHLETQNSRLCQMTPQVLALAVELRKGTIDPIMEKSGLELDLEALPRCSAADD